MEWYFIVLIVLTSLTVLWWISSLILSRVFFGRPRKTIDISKPDKEIAKRVPSNWRQWIPQLRKLYIENQKYQQGCTSEYEIISDSGNKIHGWLVKNKDNKSNDKRTVVLFAHGFHSTHNTDMCNLANWMIHEGFDMLAFDQEGYGQSEGKHTGFGALDYPNVMKWVELINKVYNHNVNIILQGVSMGANTVLLTADKEMENVKFIIADCGFTSGYEEFKSLMKLRALYGSIRAYLKMMWHVDYKKVSTLDTVKNSKYPILFIHGKEDKFVSTKFSIQNFEACTSPKELVLVEGATHALSSLMNPKLYCDKIHEFVIKYNK